MGKDKRLAFVSVIYHTLPHLNLAFMLMMKVQNHSVFDRLLRTRLVAAQSLCNNC